MSAGELLISKNVALRLRELADELPTKPVHLGLLQQALCGGASEIEQLRAQVDHWVGEAGRLRRALDQCRLASGLSKAEIIDAALSGAPSETPQPVSKEPALLLSRAAKWLAVQRGESAKSTRELIEQLVAEVDRLRETLQRYIEHHEHCTITQYYGVREKSELSRLRDAQETDAGLATTMEIVSVMEKALREIGEFTLKSHVQPVQIARDAMRKLYPGYRSTAEGPELKAYE